jgi:hypothetical protein
MLYLLLGALGVLSFFAFITRWQTLLWGLVCFLPFSGLLILWSKQDPLFLLAKDILYVLPLLLAVFLLRPQVLQRAPIAPWLTLTLLLLALVVVLQCLNPGVVNSAMALIGLKVWLLYIPLAYIVAGMLETRRDMVLLLRMIVAVAPIPCFFGLAQWGLSETIGYRQVMFDFYGDAARGATQNFAQFDLGGTIRRIPSTFTNAASYFVYTLVVVSAALALQAMDPKRGWRIFARAVLAIAFFAALLSGMRAAFVFTPLLILIYSALSGRLGGALNGLFLVAALAGGFIYITGFDVDGVVEGVTEHSERYQATDFAWVQFSYALEWSPLGQGTGTNTVSARYGLDDEQQSGAGSSLGSFEVQYAKVVHELGIFGLVPFVLLVAGLSWHVLVGTLNMRDPALRRAHGAFGGFVLIIFLYFFKAWVIDVDPGNVFFWIWVGLLYRVRSWDSVRAPLAMRSAPMSPRRLAPGQARLAPRLGTRQPLSRGPAGSAPL